MTSIEKKYLFRVLYLIILYIAGKDIKKEAVALAERFKIIFRESFED